MQISTIFIRTKREQAKKLCGAARRPQAFMLVALIIRANTKLAWVMAACGWLEEVADLLETIHCESEKNERKQEETQNKQEYTVNFLADIDMTIITASPEEAREKAEKAFGEYRNKTFDYAYLAEIKYITKSDGTEA